MVSLQSDFCVCMVSFKTPYDLIKKTCMLDYDNLYGDELLVIAN